MEFWLAGGFLPLLLLAWLPAGLAHQISATINVSVGLDVVLQCLLQTGSNDIAVEVKHFNTTQNNGEMLNKDGVEMQNSSFQLIFTGVSKAHTGTYTCRMENTRNISESGHAEQNKDDRQTEESDITVKCRFKIWLENLPVKWYKPAGLEAGNQINTTTVGENCTNLTSASVSAVSTGICDCRVSITRLNLTDAGNNVQGTVSGLKFLLSIFFGLAVGTLLYMPIIGILLWQCRKNRKGKFVSMQVVEGDQLSTAAPVTGTEDLTYANLKFEKKEVKPTSSDVIYTKIKPLQQKQSGGDAGDAKAEVDVSPEGEGK
ncbi:uncharacterized protein LOC141743172 isoform X1 [Larus michahellis]|uniref:uncharacterized protein LOC141743172 isoform X1 n=1 Tax=Larus michahellis TaxID=119627 RepID=UPI003D9B4527